MTPRRTLMQRQAAYLRMTPAEQAAVDAERLCGSIVDLVGWLRLWDAGVIREPDDRPKRGRRYFSAREQRWHYPSMR